MGIARFSMVAAIAVGLAVSTPALACGPDEMMTHMGVVAAVDASAGTLTLVDAQTGRHLVFQITAEQAKSVHPNARVSIQYAELDGKLIAETISA
ncbi:MAG: hypothetical protein OEY97_00175 [Nitrospirota bacterium]|nr:hypothetical protein [Nitrospirota bacterium]